MAVIERRKSYEARIGGVRVGGAAPVMVQSMTNTDTADIPSTVKQVAALARAGSEVVQMYIRDVFSSVTRPVKELKGFRRVVSAPSRFSPTAARSVSKKPCPASS